MTAKRSDKQRRRGYVKDPDLCRVCLYGRMDCPAAEHLAKGLVTACIGWRPAMQQV